LVLFTTLKQSTHSDVFPVSVTNELKGLGILTVVFAHFAYMKVTNADFLFPLSIIAGVGVDLFLFMSGFGLTVGMIKRPMKAVDFYKKRVGVLIWPLCQGQLKKECELMKPKDDFCIEQESSFLSSTDIFHYCNISYIFLLLFLHLLCFYMYLIQFRLSYDQRKIP
jgi:hypothetical protein